MCNFFEGICMKLLFAIALLLSSIASADDSVKQTQLQDGTTIEIVGDSVNVVDKDGSKKPAPDGEHTLADGSKLVIKDGKKQ